MLILEIFKSLGDIDIMMNSTGSKNVNIISVDENQKSNPDILIDDILKWDYKSLYTKSKIKPDFIWANPLGKTYSVISYSFKPRVRNFKNNNPISKKAKRETEILDKILEIIKYFMKINPKLKFVIVNPRGLMRKEFQSKSENVYTRNGVDVYISTVYFCNFDDPRTRPTDLFSNYRLKINQDPCVGEKLITGTTPNNRVGFPIKLIKDIIYNN